MAERLGFRLVDTYTSFTSFPPVENVCDLTEADWKDWGDYYKARTDEESRLLTEQLFAYVKANDVEDARATVIKILQHKDSEAYTEMVVEDGFSRLRHEIQRLHTVGMCRSFIGGEWE